MGSSRTVDLSGLRPYQIEGVRWLNARARALLSDEQRLGKTAQVLKAIDAHGSALIVCPAIVRGVWRDECYRWRPDLRVFVQPLDVARKQGGIGTRELWICSYDSLPRPIPGWTRGLVDINLKHVTLVPDEVHCAKGEGAIRTRRLRLLSQQCGKTWGLTGTPLQGKPDDLWGVLVSCGLAEEVFGSWEGFLEAFGAKQWRGRIRYDKPADWVAEKLRTVMLRRTRAQVAPHLPPKTYQDIPVPVPEDFRELLTRLDARWQEVGTDDLPPFELVAEARSALATARIPHALEHVKSRLESGPVVVFSVHRDPVLAMRDIGAGVIVGETRESERADLIRRFQSGALKCLALTIDAGGVGINLSRADVAVFVDLDWTPGNNAQAEDRLVDLQKTSRIHIDRLVTDHPLDRRVLSILSHKQSLIAEVVG